MTRPPEDAATEPVRLGDDAGATSLERALVRAGQDGIMPAAQKLRVWTAIAGQLVPPPGAPAPVSGGTSPAGAAGTGGAVAGAGLLKGLSVVALVASGAGLWAYREAEGTPSAVVPVASRARPAEVTASARVEAPAEAVLPASATSNVVPPKPTATGNVVPPQTAAVSNVVPPNRGAASSVVPPQGASDRVSSRTTPVAASTDSTRPSPSSTEPPPVAMSRLSDEAHAVLVARAALRAGNPSAALRELSAAQALFPRGALGQEREALTIDALARAGQKAAASARAEAFLQRFPRSPHANDVRRFVAPR